MNTKTLLNKAGIVKQYFTRGHTTIGVAFVLGNTLGVFFQLIPGIKEAFHGDFLYFAAVFIPTYMTIMIVFGIWDMKKGTYGGELLTGAIYSPNWQILVWMMVEANWDSLRALKFIEPYVVDNLHGIKIQHRDILLQRIAELEKNEQPQKDNVQNNHL